MEQILARLLAEMDAIREKMDANLEKINEGQEEMKALACLIDAYNARSRIWPIIRRGKILIKTRSLGKS
jgi:peptidoglycan hydrolase CwlO-like protein